MPWHIETDNPDCSGYAVVPNGGSTPVGCHKTREAANRQLAALYANVEDAKRLDGRPMMISMERKSYPFEVKTFDQAEGKATILVSVYNIPDADDDVVLPGAMEKSLKRRTPKFVADHEWDTGHKLGKVLGHRETSEGKEFDVQFNLEKQIAREVLSDWLFDPEGTEFSFGYGVPPGGAERKDGKRFLSEIEVYEIGPVLMGLHPNTRLVGAKGDTPFQSLTINLPENWTQTTGTNIPDLSTVTTTTTDSTNANGIPGADTVAEGDASTTETVDHSETQQSIATLLTELGEVLSR